MKVHEFQHEMTTTSAILGRSSGINVEFEGTEAKTDGRTIYLPAMGQHQDLTHEQVLAMRGYVDHEAGHIRHSDMPRIISFYDKNTNNQRPELSHLHNALEDVWMEERVVDEYPGAYKNLRQTDELVRSHEWAEVQKVGVEEAREVVASDVNKAAGMSIVTAKGYDTENSKNMRSLLSEEMQAMGEHYADLALDCENSGEVIELAKRIYQYNQETSPEDQSPEDFDQKAEAGELDDMAGEDGEGENSPGYGQPSDDGALMDAIKEALKEASEGEGDGPSVKIDMNSKDRGEILTMEEEYERGGGGIGSCTDNGLRGGYRVLTTAADVTYKRGTKPNRKHTVEVQSAVNDTTHGPRYDQHKQTLRSEVMVMKNKLRRATMARAQRDWDYGRESGRLDSKRLVAASQGVKQVWKRRTDREDHDTAITMLIDLSGSMSGSRVRVARDSAMALAECFEGTPINYRISGFSNNGWGDAKEGIRSGKYHRYERLDHSIFKDFDDNLRTTRGSVYRIDECVGGNNSDYDFVDKELYTLSRRPEKRKILFVLSDGNVACRSDAPTSEHEKLIKENLKHYKRYGVESIGIGIEDSSVKKIYPDQVVINNVQDLSGAVFGKLTDVLFRDQRNA